MPKGLLIAAFDYRAAHADEFHDWYDLEHLPERQRVPGFGACERWIGADDPTVSVATYDLDTVRVLGSEAYQAIAYENLSPWSRRVTGMCTRLLRFEGVQTLPGSAAAPEGLAAGGFLLNAMNVSPEGEDDFNAWYDEEHIPALAGVPGTLAARRYKASDSGSHTYVAIYHLVSPDVTRTEAWAKAVDTPWSARVRPHFRDRLRILCRRYDRAKDRGAA
jgi:hypothetical protein